MEQTTERSLLDALGEHLQAQLELEMKRAGEARFAQMQNNIAGGHEGTGPVGQRLIAHSVRVATEAIRKGIEDAMAGRPQHRALAVEIIKDMDAEVLAVLTGRALVDGFAAQRGLTAVATNLGRMVEEEARLGAFADANPGAFDWTMRRVKETEGATRKLSVTRHLMRLKGVQWNEWPNRHRVMVGYWLLDQFNGATGLFSVDVAPAADPRKARPGYVLNPKPETTAWMQEAARRMELAATEYWPTVIPPKPWRKPWGGGYHTKLVPTQMLVKIGRDGGAKEYLSKLKESDLAFVYDAVNRVQATPWKINSPVLEVLREIDRRGLDVEGLAPGQDLEVPPRPVEADTDPSVHKSWCKGASIVHRTNRKNRGKRIQVARTVMMADRFKDYPAIYFPHQLDFRGRMYPTPAFLNPQGADYQKALLTFAEGKPVETEEQLHWLAVHGANCFGVDKVPFADRWNWVVENEAAIRAVAADPLGTGWDFWTGADSPFCFLAWAFDFVAVLDGGFGTVSCIPVALDGSCNGLQHYSAALRDPIGGAAVNLVPGDRPRDIYATVAERVLDKLRLLKDTSGPDGDMARKWLAFGVDRKVTKRSVMTLPYGCSVYSVREFIEDAMREKLSGGKDNPFATVDEAGARKDGLFDASKFLQAHVWKAIGDTVVAARHGMDWLQEVAKHCARTETPICWETADGFPVQQAYPEIKERQIETRFHGKIIKPRIHEETDKVDRNRQRNGIAPNWVHSMDGCALRMFVRLAGSAGVSHFALVHDSYGSLAADVPTVAWALREAFYLLYCDNNPLEDFKAQVFPMLPPKQAAEISAIPPTGTLDLTQVRESPYFFA